MLNDMYDYTVKVMDKQSFGGECRINFFQQIFY